MEFAKAGDASLLVSVVLWVRDLNRPLTPSIKLTPFAL